MKNIKLLALIVFILSAFVMQVWGEEELIYTLTPASGSNNGYAGNCNIVISGITWNLTGNSQQQPWRIGGKSLTDTDRALYSKTAISSNISKIVVTHGAASSITVNSITVIVSTNSDFSSPISTLTPTFTANADVTINRPDGKDWSNCFYKIVYNVTVSGSNNKFLEFTSAKFYTETTSTCEEGKTVNFNAGAGSCATTSLTETCDGSGVVLPNVTASGVCKGWTTFAGWATAAVSDSTTTSVTLYAAGETYIPSSDGETLYAVFSKSKGSGRDEGYYITTSLSVGKTYIFGAVKAEASASLANNIAFGAVAFTNTFNDTENNWGSRVDLTPNTSGYVGTTSVTAACKWVLESVSEGNYSFKNNSNYIYLGSKEGSKKVGAQSGISTSANMYLENVNGVCKSAFMCHPASSSTNVMLYNTSNGYRMYAPRTYSATMSPYIRFYEYDAGSTTYYCSDPNCCTPLGAIKGSLVCSNRV